MIDVFYYQPQTNKERITNDILGTWYCYIIIIIIVVIARFKKPNILFCGAREERRTQTGVIEVPIT